MKIKLIIIAVYIFTFFTPVFAWAGCSDASIYGSWIVWGKKLNGNEWESFYEEIGFNGADYIRIGQCYKFLRGCSILHCKKSKREIYNRLINAGKRGLAETGIIGSPNYRLSSKGMCLTGHVFNVYGFGSLGKSMKIDPASWGLPNCVPVP